MARAVVGFIDMDCFYVAVERQRDPRLRGVPCAVVQYNSRQRGGAPDLPAEANRWVHGGSASGGIIAVSYEARSRGVTRQMNAQEARRHCPEIVLVQVPTAFGKADLKIYKDAGDSVVSLLSRRAGACEKRSVDEVAIDITAEADRLLQERDWSADLLPAAQQASHLADSVQSRSATTFSRDETRRGHAGQQLRGADGEAPAAQGGGWAQSSTWGSAERRLVAGSVVVAELRASIAAELGFTCSGGVAENKILAKLGCGLHKPDQQTIVLPEAVAALLHDLPLDRLPGLGGDLGAQVRETLQVNTASELAAVPRERLEAAFPRQATFLIEMAEGRRFEPVQDREHLKSLNNGKTFMGHLSLKTVKECERWLNELAGELHQRYLHDLARNNRAPTRISVSIGTSGAGGGAAGVSGHTRQVPVDLGPTGSVQQIASAARECFRRWLTSGAPSEGLLGVVSLGLSLSGMQPVATAKPITSFFKAAEAPPPKPQREQQSSEAGTAKSITSFFKAAAAPVAAAPPPKPHCEQRSGEAAETCLIDLESPERCRPGSAEDCSVELIEASGGEEARPCELELPDPGRSANRGRPTRSEPPGQHTPQGARPASSARAAPPADPLPTEVDPSVLAELPPDIQAEVRRQMLFASHRAPEPQPKPAAKRQKGAGGGIEIFFRPASRGAAGA